MNWQKKLQKLGGEAIGVSADVLNAQQLHEA